VCEEAECKLRSVNFRRKSEPRRAYRPAFGVTGISDGWYRSTSVSNGSKFPVLFRVRVRPTTAPLQWVSTQNPLHKSEHFLLHLSIGVLIVSRHNLFMKYAVRSPRSSPILRFAIGSIVVESRWKPGHFGVISGLISKQVNEY